MSATCLARTLGHGGRSGAGSRRPFESLALFVLLLALPLQAAAQTYNFNGTSTDGWTLAGGFTDGGTGPVAHNFSGLAWDGITNYPNAIGLDPRSDTNGSVRFTASANNHGIVGSGAFWIMRMVSPDLSGNAQWQKAVGYSVKINANMGPSSLWCNLYVRIFDITRNQDRYFFSGTAAAVTKNSWNTFSFDWSNIAPPTPFPTNYVIRDVFINVWGQLSGSYTSGSVYLDDVVAVTDTTPPSIQITSPTSNPTLTTGATTLDLAGSASDNIKLEQVIWTNSRGGSGIASGTSGWSVTGIALQPGTNVITVTAQDRAQNLSSDTLTVSYVPPQTLTVAGAGTGSGSVTSHVGLVPAISCSIAAGTTSGACAQTYPYNTSVVLTAAPTAGSNFTSWTNCPTPSGAQCSVAMTAARTVTATFTTTTAPPTITAIAPSSGKTSGGARITVTGTAFIAGQTRVTIGGAAATGVSVINGTTLTAATPPGLAGAQDVTVSTGNGSATLAGAFVYSTGVVRTEVTGNRDIVEPSLDFSGTYVAFASQASDLVAGDANGAYDVFVRNRDTGAIVRLSVGANGAEANGDSRHPRISRDGRYVAFVSGASNLVAGDGNGVEDIFVADRDGDGDRVFDEPQDLRILRVSPGPAVEPNGASGQPDLSSDGGWVAYVSSATNLVPGDTNGWADVFVTAWKTGDTTLVTRGIGGQPANGPSRAPALSVGGKVVVYASDASNLVTGDSNGLRDVFRLDRETGVTTRLSNARTGVAPLLSSRRIRSDTFVRAHATLSVGTDGEADEPDVSEDGESVVFEQANADPCGGTSVTSIVISSPGTLASPYLCVTTPPNGQPANGDSHDPVISDTGDEVAWTTSATNLTDDVDTNGVDDIVQTSISDPDPTRASEAQDGSEFGGASAEPALSGDGQSVAMATVNPASSGGPRQELVVSSDPLRLDTIFGVNGGLTGPLAGGTPVDLRGAGFAPATEVWFGAGKSTNITFVSGGRLLAQSPPAAGGGRVDVRAVNADGSTATLRDAFEYLAPGSVPPNDTDTDADGLTDSFEIGFGLDPGSPFGQDGAGGDPDGDGVVNAEEQRRHSHPRGLFSRYFAEGASGLFETDLSMANPTVEDAHVLVRLQKDDGTEVALPPFVLAPMRSTDRAIRALGVGGLQGTSFATVVESDVPVVADRQMSWGTADAYGSHAERALTAPARTWYLAEGATHSGFDTFYLIQNPNVVPISVQVQYLLPSPRPPVVRTYQVAALQRFTVWLNLDPALQNTDVSGIVESVPGNPIIVERAMYKAGPYATGVRLFNAGHESAGVNAPGTEWFLAEGATGSEFDTFYLLANPTSTDATIEITYLPEGVPPVTKVYTVAAQSRRTIWVDLEAQQLASVAVSARVRSIGGVPILVERAMWWPGGPSSWYEGHDSVGTTVSGTKWATANGSVTTPFSGDTFILIANTSSYVGRADVTLLLANDAPQTRSYVLPPNSRKTVWVRADFPGAMDRRFGVVVESVPAAAGASPAQIVVEQAVYNNALQVDALGRPTGLEEVRAAGAAALATRIK